MLRFIVIFFILIINLNSYASFFETFKSKKARNYYQKEDFENSLKEYTSIDRENDREKLQYNLGCVFYKLKKMDEANKIFLSLTGSKNKKLLANTFYNLGNIAYEKGEYNKAVNYYKEAVKLFPESRDYRYNLERALLKKQMKKKQNNKNNENKKDKNNNKNNNKKNDKKNKNNKDNKNKQDKQKNNSKPKENKKIEEKLKEQYLKMLLKKEKEIYKKLNDKKEVEGYYNDKDW